MAVRHCGNLSPYNFRNPVGAFATIKARFNAHSPSIVPIHTCNQRHADMFHAIALVMATDM